MPSAALILVVSGGTALPTHAASAQESAQTSAQTSAQANGHKKVLVQLRETGGFAGIDDRVTVYTNGCARFSRRQAPPVNKCLTRGEMRKLRGYLKHLRVGCSEKQPQGADFIKYTLAYHGHRASRYTLPRTWSPVVRQLEKALQKYAAPA
ncbi:hypothetical protein Mth01_53750 [Sphaerimonospora thailandensis]|uniref:Uncharacterized protein n=1 Tax=Sphaerimonospora thailandensis TaxID=795644 RepID=A0A8J3RFV0_9ACTN|nr:hypothetical protein Mth01_53750 [Sphaerimonospora thailandensis]